MKRLTIVATLGIAGLMAIPASAQWNPYGQNNGGWHRHRDHDRDRDRNRGNWGWQDRDRRGGYGQYGNSGYGNYSRESQNQAYQQGYNDGIYDRQHGPQRRSRNWSHDYDAQAYRDGYNAAYNGGYGRTGTYGNNGTWRNRNGYPAGQYGNNYGVQRAQEMGYQDGLNEGSKDVRTGHSYRPTESPAYKDADHGQSVSGISKDQYKQIYRQAYMQGYQRGYGQNGGYGRRY